MRKSDKEIEIAWVELKSVVLIFLILISLSLIISGSLILLLT